MFNKTRMVAFVSKPNIFYAISIVFLLLILPFSNVIVLGTENPITTLSSGSSEEIIKFPEGGGFNNEHNLSIPEDAIITNAQLELIGLSVQGALQKFTHTYSDTVNNKAWLGTTTQHPPNAAPSSYTTTAFSSREYTYVATSDNSRAIHSTKGANNIPYHLFEFSITETGINNIEVYWEGYGCLNGPSIWPYWAYLYLWNNNNSAWELIGSNSSNVNPVDFVIQKQSIGNYTSYVDKSNYLYLMAQGPQVVDNQSSSDIFTDFIKVVVTGIGISYPSDTTLNVGDDDDIEWQNFGIFNKNVIINDNFNLKYELQSLIDAASTGIKSVIIPLNFSSATEGEIKILNISISYEFPEINLPPELVSDIPYNTYSFYEDTEGGDNLIDLNNYIWDDRDNGSLKYLLIKNDDNVIATLDSDGHHLDFSAKPDYFGTAEFQVRAVDKGLNGNFGGGDDLFIESNIFTITVLPTNDPPVIDSVGGITILESTTEIKFMSSKGAFEETWFNKTIIAHDIDGDRLNFSTNLTFTEPAKLLVKPDEGESNIAKLSLFASNDLVGIWTLKLIVNDNNETGKADPKNPNPEPLYDSIDLIIEITNVNDPPILTQITELSGIEDQWLNFSLSALDDDSIHDDKLIYSTNLTQAIRGLKIDKNFEFNQYTGEISILPDNEQVGEYWVEFTASDLEESSDSEIVKLVIINSNDKPIADISSPLNKQRFNDSTPIYFDGANTTDDDLIHGDVLSYLWTSNISGELSTKPVFTKILTDLGWHEITLTVSDNSNTIAHEQITLQIIKSVVPDDTDDDKVNPDDGKQDKSGENNNNDLFTLIIVLIVIIMIVLLISLFLYKKRKKSKIGKDDIETEQGAIMAQTPGTDLPTFDQNQQIQMQTGFPQNQVYPMAQPYQTQVYQVSPIAQQQVSPAQMQQMQQVQQIPQWPQMQQPMLPPMMPPANPNYMSWDQQTMPMQSMPPYQQQIPMAQTSIPQQPTPLTLPKAGKIIED